MAPTVHSRSDKQAAPEHGLLATSTSRIQKRTARPRADNLKATELAHALGRHDERKDTSNHKVTKYASPSIVAQPVPTSSLLQLPGELRNHIYGYVLSGQTISTETRAEKHQLALLSTCRQIYTEARMIPYTTCTFSISAEGDISRWVSKLSAGAVMAVTSIEIFFRACSLLSILLAVGTLLRKELRPWYSDYDTALGLLPSLKTIHIKMKERDKCSADRCHECLCSMRQSIGKYYPGIRVSAEHIRNYDGDEPRVAYISSEGQVTGWPFKKGKIYSTG